MPDLLSENQNALLTASIVPTYSCSLSCNIKKILLTTTQMR